MPSKRRIQPGLIEGDKDECAIVVHYTSSDGVSDDLTQHTKRLRLNPRMMLFSDPVKSADDVMRQCKYVAESKRQFVEMLIANLQEYYAKNPEALTRAQAAQEAARQRRRRKEGQADMDAIDEYVEMLYEGDDDNGVVLEATERILSLALNFDNLETLVQHQTLMGALSRVFGEEYKRSVDLTYNIGRVFLVFSNYGEMHPILSNFRVGVACVDIVEFQVKRSQHREEVEGRMANDIAEAKINGKETGVVEDLEKARSREASRNRNMQRKQDKVLFVCLQILANLAAASPNVEYRMVRKNLIEHMSHLFSHSTSVDLLILTALFMKKLSVMEENKERMGSSSSEFLHRICRFLPGGSPQQQKTPELLVVAILQLLFHLSFDAGLRETMVKTSIIPKLVASLKDNFKYRELALRILYHVSVEDRCKSMFAYTDAIPIVMQLIVKFPATKRITRELAALAVNLSLNRRNAEIMATQNKGLQHLINRVEHTQDPLLMKVVRNISLWTFQLQEEMRVVAPSSSPAGEEEEEESDAFFDYPQRGLWARHVPQLLQIATTNTSHDMLVEALGTLANLTKDDLMRGATWAKYVEEMNLTGFLSKLLVPGMAQHDIVLETVMFIGVVATNKEAASMIVNSSLRRSLEEVWRIGSDDAEIVLQLLFTYKRLLKHDGESHHELLYNSHVLLDILDCLDNPNGQVRRYADACLDLVVENDRDQSYILGDLGAQVRRRRFYSHNKEWLEVSGGQSSVADDDDEATFAFRGEDSPPPRRSSLEGETKGYY